MSPNEPIEIEVFADYGCPYVHAAAHWLHDLRAELGDQVQVTWRFFPLEQINAGNNDPDWRVWEQPLDPKNRVQLGFRGAIAARRQGLDKFEAFHLAWLDARHAMQPGVRPPTVEEVAQRIGLDMVQFERDLNDPALWATMACDFQRGVEEFGVFGTPTFVFPNGESAYLKMKPAPPKEEAVALWHDFVATVTTRPNIHEIKRPKKPAAS